MTLAFCLGVGTATRLRSPAKRKWFCPRRMVVCSSRDGEASSPPAAPFTNAQAPSQSAGAAFASWAAENRVDLSQLRLNVFESGFRGMAAAQVLQKDDELASVPSQVCLQVNSLDRKRTPIASNVSQETWQKMPWFARLALVLISEKIGPTKLQPWIAELPEDFDTPFHWSEQELSELQSRRMTRAIHSQRKSYRALFDSVNSNPNNGISRQMSYNDFVWAVECVRSRAFSGPLEVAPFKERVRLFVFVFANTIAWPSLNILPWDNALNGGLTALFALTMYDILQPKILKVVQGVQLRRYAMTPGIDFINHSSRMTGLAEVAYEYFSDRFVVRSGEAYQAGNQVYISYGAQSSDSFLQYYGFVEEDNPAEEYVFGSEVENMLGVEAGTLIAKRGAGFAPTVVSAIASRKFGGKRESARQALKELCYAELDGMKTTIADDRKILDALEDKANSRFKLAVRYRVGKKQLLADVADQSCL